MKFVSRRSAERVRQPRVDETMTNTTFRRSRTLTGSISSQVVAANENNGQLRSSRLKSQDLRSHRRSLGGILLVVFVGIAGTIWLLDQLIMPPRILFEPATVSAADSARYAKLFNDYLAGRPLQYFEFALNDNELSKYMVDRAPELVSAVIRGRSGLFAHDLILAPRTPLARWQLADKTYYVDNSGVLFEHNLMSDPTLLVKDESGLSPATQQVASKSMLIYIGKVVGGLSSQIAPVQEVVIPPATLKEVDVVITGLPYRVRLNIDREPTGQVTDVTHAIRYVQQHSITPQYIDARVEGKAFYQ